MPAAGKWSQGVTGTSSYALQEAVMTFFIVIPVRNYFIHSLNQLLDLL